MIDGLERVGRGDTRYLYQPRRGGTWMVRIDLPRPIGRALGRKEMTRTTGTADLRAARTIRDTVILPALRREVANMKLSLEEATDIRAEVLRLRALLQAERDPDGREVLQDHIEERARKFAFDLGHRQS